MATTTPEQMTLPQLREFQGTLYVRNNSMKQVHIRTMVAGQRVDVELTPAGQMDSIATLPKPCLELRGFQRLWMRGEVTVSPDPAIEEEITLLMNQHVKAPEARLQEILGRGGPVQTTDEPAAPVLSVNPTPQSRALEEKPCAQCGRVNREGVIEGGRVVQSAADAKLGVPPLCDEHVDLTHLFTASQEPDGQGGTTWKFTRTEVNAPKKGIA